MRIPFSPGFRRPPGSLQNVFPICRRSMWGWLCSWTCIIQQHAKASERKKLVDMSVNRNQKNIFSSPRNWDSVKRLSTDSSLLAKLLFLYLASSIQWTNYITQTLINLLVTVVFSIRFTTVIMSRHILMK